MKNKLTRKLMLSAFTLLFAVISLGASTYAWFTLSKDANVNAFGGTVTAGNSGLEIAVAPIGYDGDVKLLTYRSTTIDIVDDLKNLHGTNLENVVFDALQNKAEFDGAAFKDFDNETVTEGYIGFELYFRLADSNEKTQAAPIYCTDLQLNTVDSDKVQTWYVNKEYKDLLEQPVLAGSSKTYYVSDAARIAMVGTETKIYETQTLIGADGFKSTHAQDIERATALAKSNEGKELKDVEYETRGAMGYYNEVNDTKITYPASYYEVSAQNDDYVVCTISAGKGQVAKVSVYVWIEGWDAECINAIFRQSLEVILKFEIKTTDE